MLELVALWGFIGGLLRAFAGFLTYGKPPLRKVLLAVLVTGFVGIVSAFAVFYLEAGLYLISWKAAVAAALVGYVGVDLLGSLFEMLEQRKIEI